MPEKLLTVEQEVRVELARRRPGLDPGWLAVAENRGLIKQVLDRTDLAAQETVLRELEYLAGRAPDALAPTSPATMGFTPDDDQRFRLITELAALAHPEAEEWNAISVRPWTAEVTAEVADPFSASYGIRQGVSIDIDSQVPLETLLRSLRTMWPKLRTEGLVFKSNKLGDRSLALIRFVCCEDRSATWHARFVAWNARFPDWAFTTRREFISRFRDGEKRLTGHKWGLEWYYDPLSRLSLSELVALEHAGDAGARRRLRSMRADPQARFYPLLRNVSEEGGRLAQRQFADGLLSAADEAVAQPPDVDEQEIRARVQQEAERQWTGSGPVPGEIVDKVAREMSDDLRSRLEAVGREVMADLLRTAAARLTNKDAEHVLLRRANELEANQ